MFVPVAAQIIGDLIKREVITPHAEVLELGNQTYSVDESTIIKLEELFRSEKILAEKYGVKMPKLESLRKVRPAMRPKDTTTEVKDFFSALGFNSYTTIDINADFGSLVMDLNRDLEEEYGFTQKFGLVTNIGVSEHLIGQANFMHNAHNATMQGGIMLHILPFLGYISHGFFNYQPRFFQDLASANDYELLGLYLAERDRIVLDLSKPAELLIHFYQYLHLLLDNERYGGGLVVAVLRKNGNGAFSTPLQGKYLKDIASGNTAISHYYGQKEHTAVTKGFFSLPTKTPLRVRIKAKLLKVVSSILKAILKYL